MNENITATGIDEALLHRSVREAFDAVAGIFDESFENAITRKIRERLYALISELLPTGAHVLDVNCGTGIDAIELARKGYKVKGADLSPGMILQAKEKAARGRVPAPDFRVASFDELLDVFDGPFGLILSNFGGLNCVPDLRPVAERVESLLAPRGVFLAVVMPRLSPWDSVAALSRGRLRSVFPRFRKNVEATGFLGKTFPVYYHSLSSLNKAFAETCHLEQAFGLSVITPPPHATTFLRRFPRLCSLLEATESQIASWPAVRSMGDHYVAVFRKHSS